jgi:hypothetical protein
MNLAAVALLALVFGLLFYDFATLGRGRRARRVLLLEALVFAAGAFFIAFPDAATLAAHGSASAAASTSSSTPRSSGSSASPS